MTDKRVNVLVYSGTISLPLLNIVLVLSPILDPLSVFILSFAEP